MRRPCIDSRAVTLTAVRPELTCLAPETVIVKMQRRQWDFESRVSEGGWYWARFRRWTWCDVPLGSPVSFGFSTKTGSGDDVTAMRACVHRAAELCLRVEEMFVDDLPSNPDIHGLIRPEPDCIADSWRQWRAKHEHLELDEIQRRQREQRILVGEFLFERHGFFHLIVGGRELLLTDEALEKLASHIELVWAKRRGDIAL